MTTTPEALTPEERAHLQLVASMTREGDRAGGALAKLLRIHDQQAARIAELEHVGRGRAQAHRGQAQAGAAGHARLTPPHPSLTLAIEQLVSSAPACRQRAGALS
jgi:hypothetical protein